MLLLLLKKAFNTNALYIGFFSTFLSIESGLVASIYWI